MKALVKGKLNGAISPLYAYLDSRFQRLQEHFDGSVGTDHRAHLDHRLDDLENRVGWVEDRVNDRAADLQVRMDQLESNVTIDTQTAAEFAATFRRATDQLQDQLAALFRFVAAGTDPHLPELIQGTAAGDPQAELELAKLLHEILPGVSDRLAGELVGVEPSELGPGAAALLNWALGHTGPSGQAEVWLNHPVTLLHEAGSVHPNAVNERIVEVPYALAAAAELAPGAQVLDFGATESTFALSLASLGLNVLAADLRPYPFHHPNLRPLTGPIEDWPGPDEALDAIFSISTLEHVGLGAYGEKPTHGDDLDRAIIERFSTWLRPGGELVLTAPYGAWDVGPQQRIYDRAHLEALLAGWEVRDRRVCVQTAHDCWERSDGEPQGSTWADGHRGVVLLRAVPDR